MRDLELVRHLARVTAGTTDVDRMLEIGLEVVCDHLGAGLGTVWQLDTAGAWRMLHRYEADVVGDVRPSPSDTPAVVVASMLATATPSSLWRDEQGCCGVATLVGDPERPRAVLEFQLQRVADGRELLMVCETTAELLTGVVERAASQAQLLEAQQLAQLGSWRWDVVTDDVVLSDQLLTNLGVAEGSFRPTLEGFLATVHPEDRASLAGVIAEVVEDQESFEVTFRTCPDARGRVRWLLCRGRGVAGPDGRAVQVIGTAQDVTERTELARELEYRTNHDVVTGLANRAAFEQRLDGLLQQGDPPSVVVAVVDVDGFGPLAKQSGRGDAEDLLRTIGQRLRDRLPPDAVVARLVGDEFAVAVASGQRGPQDPAALGATARGTFEELFDVAGQLEPVTASVGVAQTVRGDESAHDLLRDAALAVDLAKTRGGDRVQLFDSEHHEQALQQLAMEADLRQAVRQGDLTLAYQPVVEASTGTMVATEALVRWDRPGRGPVSPAVFIPLAERLGLACKIGSQVLLAACEQTAAWRREFPDAADLSVAVNLSALQLDDPTIIATVEEVLHRSGLAPEHLMLEVTESALPDDAAGALARLWALRRLGVKIAIDDFGTGYSTLSRLRELPVDILKIDRSFLADTGRDAPILHALFSMARTLELATVAEGVETAAQLAAVLANQGDRIQGYLFSRPLTAAGIERLLHDPTWDTGDLAEVRTVVPASGGDLGRLDPLMERFMAVEDAGAARRVLHELLVEVAAETGMDSVYVTRVDLAEQRQDIRVAANTGRLEIPEGDRVAWSDALCHRALLDDRAVVADVQADYPDVPVVEELGIATFVVVPLRSMQGGLYGTLCAAAGEPRQQVPAAVVTLLRRVAALVTDRLPAIDGEVDAPRGH